MPKLNESAGTDATPQKHTQSLSLDEKLQNKTFTDNIIAVNEELLRNITIGTFNDKRQQQKMLRL